ncbi:MAG TPA: hypothetical protein PKD53_13015 [Chloroflexaceae bacterium]|nr:hypothetical protein [Chloroflexaceae bacterium]
MKASALLRLPAALLIAAMMVLFTAGTAGAHGHEHVGPYEVVIGFRTEPAVQGEPNGLDLRVTNHETGAPVIGLEATLQAEISFGGATMPLELRPRWGQEGAYTAEVLPTEAGDYTFRIFGAIEGTPVDMAMTSSPDTFSSVESKASIAFPAPEATPAELAAAAAAAQQQARLALIVGGLGALLGLAGLGVALAATRGRRAAEPAGVRRTA